MLSSQVQAINGPAPKSWGDYENGCLLTYRGGHHDVASCSAFQHGMRTVFNLLREEFPPAEQCKAAPLLLEAAEAMLQWHRGAYDHGDSKPPLAQLRSAIAAAEKGGGE